MRRVGALAWVPMSNDGEKSNPFKVTFSSLQVVQSPSDHFLDVDWQTILRAPLWTFELMTPGEKANDPKRRGAFNQMIASPPVGAFAAFVYPHVHKNLEPLWAARRADTRAPLVGLADAEILLSRYPKPEEAEGYRTSLVEIAKAIAATASTGLFGLRKKLDAADADALAKLRAVLRIAAE